MKRIHRIGAVALALAVAPAAWSMEHKSMSEARQQYQQDRAYCTSGQATEDRAVCLKEAAAAYAEARGGGSTRVMGAGATHDGKKTMHKAKAKLKARAKAKPDDK
jgi:Flp pilus assembly protein TadD